MSNKQESKKVASLYDVIRSPMVTEKTHLALEHNKYAFKIAPKATKQEVKAAIKQVFGVDVEKVNVINIKGKTKRFRGTLGARNNVRKAIVTLKEGQSIDIESGIK